jgi:hypothetical protein
MCASGALEARRGAAQEHKAGQKCSSIKRDQTIAVYERQTGVAWQAPVFVAALGPSSYTLD